MQNVIAYWSIIVPVSIPKIIRTKGNYYLKFLIIHSVALASSKAAAAAAEARAFLCIAS
jgi:hypothetical protein